MRRSLATGLPHLVAALLLLVAGVILTARTADANQTLRYVVASGADDAEEGDGGPGVVDTGSSDLEITEDTEGMPQLIGVRFDGIDLPRGTPILSAYVQFATDEDDKNADPFSVTLFGEAVDDAEPYSGDVPADISERPRTAASVRWANIPTWTVEHEAGPNQRSPDVKAIVQEVVDREGWQAGNALAFILTGSGTRTAESYEGSIGDVEVSDLAPQLVIVAPSAATYRVAASDDDAEEGDDAPGSMDIDSSDLEIVEDHVGTPQTLGIRFTDVTIPAGAQILSAHIQFAVDEGDKNADPFAVNLWGEASSAPAPYSASAFNISSRTKTAASVAWKDTPAWTVEEEGLAGGEHQRTPDLAAIVQEIIDRPDWVEGGALAFILQGRGQRTAEAFDGESALAPALVVSFIGEQTTPSSYRVRLTWGAGDDPATQMNVIWDQVRGSGATVHYDLYDAEQGCPRELDAYTLVQEPTRVTPYRGMNNHFAKLSGLMPDTAYRFVIADSEGTGQCMWFRTAPAEPKAFTYISGGDTKSSGDALRAGRWSNQMVAKLRPLFVFFTGDYNSGDGTDDASWQQWLSDWSEGTKSADGRVYPIVAVHGNHEDGDFEVLYNLFDAGNTDPAQAADYDYYSLNIGGDLLHLINLNSQLWLNGKVAAHETMTAWLAADLAAHAQDTFKIAGYHKPIRPHTSTKEENDHELPWAELFDEHRLTIAYESDTHNHKITFPLRRSDADGHDMGFVRDDANGVLYAGEGSWGATPRRNDDDKSWTLDSESMNQIKWNHVFPADGGNVPRIDLHTVVTARYEDGELVNYVDGVGEVDDSAPFAAPEGITLHSAPFYGEVISVPFVALDGEAPSAPINLKGEATSYSDITITWTNTADPAVVSNITVERRVGDEAWEQVGGGLPGTTQTFSQADLKDGTGYTYRVRANNVFGSSPWSDEVLVTTPVDDRARTVLTEGTDGYSGTDVIAIAQRAPDASFTAEELSFDQATSDYGSPEGIAHGLVRFHELVGSLPAGAQISAASLRFWTTSSSVGPVGLHRMLAPWDETSTWNGFGEGVQTDDVEAVATADDTKGNITSAAYLTFDVTASVQAWAAGAPNHGWLVLNQSTDGWDIATDLYAGEEDSERRPRLTVFYEAGDGLDAARETMAAAYLAYYARSADPAGQDWWAAKLAAAGGDLTELVSAFWNSPEANARYGMTTNAQLVDMVYRQLFAREPDAAGKAYYVGALDSGRLQRESLVLDIFYGATGTDLDVLANKLAASAHFTEQLRATGTPFDGTAAPNAITDNIAILDGVTLDDATVAAAREATDLYMLTWGGAPLSFARLATFPVYLNLGAGKDPASETASEIVTSAHSGRVLIYTDSPMGRIGFVDIADPSNPQPAGSLNMGGEPTSVAVKGDYALVAVNTSASYLAPSGHLAVVDVSDIANPSVRAMIDLGGQPDSVAVSPNGMYAAIAIENERDEDACAAGDGSLIVAAQGDEDACDAAGGNFGGLPQLPAGHLSIVALDGEPAGWTAQMVDLTGLAAVGGIDPEPEYVDINGRSQVVLTLQENNHLVIVDLASASVVTHFPAGSVDLTAIDAVENEVIDLLYDLDGLAREPDGVNWIDDQRFATANEGDWLGGSRGFSIFSADGTLVSDSGSSNEYDGVRVGHYPEDRAENKGVEPEGVKAARFGPHRYLFVGTERANAVTAYKIQPEVMGPVQVLPTGVGPEGLLAIPARGLFVVAAEGDSADDGFRSTLSIYGLKAQPAEYPQIQSAGQPAIGWGALSALAADRSDADTLYTVHDSYYKRSRIYTLDVGQTPAVITGETVLAKGGATVDYDLEGLVQRADGSFWGVSEGVAAGGARENLLIHIAADGTVMQEITLPDAIKANATSSGFEGVAVTGAGDSEAVYVAVQREWRDDPKGYVKIGRYLPSTGVWSFLYYPLDTPPAGAWVGLSEIVALDERSFAVLERDNQQGPKAVVKRVYRVSLDATSEQGLSYPVFTKTLVRDLLPDLQARNGWIPDKVEGLTVGADGEVYAVSDNDGLGDAVGETYFLRLGPVGTAFGM